MAKPPVMPVDREAPDGAVLPVWVIYHRPEDYPDGYVLRCQYAMEDSTVQADTMAWQADDIETLREMLPPGLHRMERHPADDPHIVETWI